MLRSIVFSCFVFISACVPVEDQVSAEDRASAATVELQRLSEARHLWQMTVPVDGDYDFSYRRNCYCAMYGNVISVQVIGGEISDFSLSKRSLSSGEKEMLAPKVRAIPDLFDEVQNLIESSLTEGTRFEVTYNRQYGYPSQIKWQSAENDGHHGSFTLRVIDVQVDGNAA